MKITVLMGGQSSERSVSQATGKEVSMALQELGHEVIQIDPGLDLPERLWQERQSGCEFVWIALHGVGGEDGTVQSMLDWIGLPYQGSGYLASALAMDKGVAKQLFRATGVLTPSWLTFPSNQLPEWSRCVTQLGSPLVIKPVDGGSTVGISIVHSAAEFEAGIQKARPYSKLLMVESYIAGKELTIGVMDEQVLPPIEIIPSKGEFYDFEAKYAPGGSLHLIPCSLSLGARERAEAMALQAYQVLGCEGPARVDLRVDGRETAWVLEVNTLPGMTATSLYPDAAAAFGWSFTQLVDRILQASLKRSPRVIHISASLMGGS